MQDLLEISRREDATDPEPAKTEGRTRNSKAQRSEALRIRKVHLRSSVQKDRTRYEDRQIIILDRAYAPQHKANHKERSTPRQESRHSPGMILTDTR
jgi:hypothetical protein